MPSLLLEPIPEVLHIQLQQNAAAHQRSVTEEAIHLMQVGLAAESKTATATVAMENPRPHAFTYWSKRKPSPEYEALWLSGALSGGTDSTVIISEERDAR